MNNNDKNNKNNEIIYESLIINSKKPNNTLNITAIDITNQIKTTTTNTDVKNDKKE